MSTATKPKSNGVPAVKPVDDSAPPALVIPQSADDRDGFDDVASSGKFLPRLQLFGGNSKQVKNGTLGMAHYAIVTGKDTLTDLGTDVDCLPLGWRPLALDTSGDTPVGIHDKNDPEFKRIVAQSDVQDSGCMFGPEFLVYLPTVKKFVAFFCNNPTNRKEAPAVRERLGQPSTLGSRFIETKKFSWHGIVCKPCSTPFDYPTQELVNEQVQNFLNPPKQEAIERAPEPATARAR